MAIKTGDKFLAVVEKSELIEPDQLYRALSHLTGRADDDPQVSASGIAEELVSHGLLTRWQADRLLEGRYRGFRLGKYKLLGHLGSGGMSSVYLAEHVKMERRVAIKVLPQKRINDSTYLPRFYREAKAAAALQHPNIVVAYDIDQEKDIHYLVMEYVQGSDLNAMVRDDGPLGYARAAGFIAQAARGLSHAHAAGLVHRDIKPANLLIDQNDTLKILDLGLARFMEEVDAKTASLTVSHDEKVLGTADYLAPEQAKNSHNVDPRADLYSLGCTLYYLLTGHAPFPEGTLAQRLLKHSTTEPPSILIDRPDAPAGLVAICQRMMAKDVQERFQTAADVEEALSDWINAYRASDAEKSASSRQPAASVSPPQGLAKRDAVEAGAPVRFGQDTDSRPIRNARPRTGGGDSSSGKTGAHRIVLGDSDAGRSPSSSTSDTYKGSADRTVKSPGRNQRPRQPGVWPSFDSSGVVVQTKVVRDTNTSGNSADHGVRAAKLKASQYGRPWRRPDRKSSLIAVSLIALGFVLATLTVLLLLAQ